MSIRMKKSQSRNEGIINNYGSPDDHIRRHTMDSHYVGASIGFTLNEGDYNSLRVDVWGTEEIRSGESRNMAFGRLVKELDSEVKLLIQEYEEK